MKRPPLITFFATFLALEALYELLLFPTSIKQEALKPLLDQMPVDLSLLVPFGIVKGIYALIGALGLWFRKDLVRYYLWIATPLFPIASIYLTGSLSLAPLGIAFTLLYVFFLRKPEYIEWFQHDVQDLPLQETTIPDIKTEINGKRIFNSLGLFLGGYFLINSIISLAMFSWPISFGAISVFFFQLFLAAALTATSLRFGDVSRWKIRLGNQLNLVAITIILYSLLLMTVMGTEQYELMNELFDGALTGKFSFQLSLYGLFLFLIGIPLKRTEIV